MGGQPDAGFEGAFSEVLLRFVNARAGRMDAEIRAAQRTLCTFFDVDRSMVCEVVPGAPVGLRLTHLWDAHSDAPPRDASNGAAMDGDESILPFGEAIAPHRADVDGATLLPWITQRAVSGVTVRLEQVDDLPVEAFVDAASALGRNEAELELRAATTRILTAVDVAGLGPTTYPGSSRA